MLKELVGKRFELTKREGSQFYFQSERGTICFSFQVSYLIDGTCVISGDLGCLTWKRNCFPKELDYGFPNKETGIDYFAEKVSQHNIPQEIQEDGKYTNWFILLFECLKIVSKQILEEVNKRNILFQVNCRDCGQPMQKASELLENTLFCDKCKLKAEVRFDKTPIVQALRVKKKTKEVTSGNSSQD